MYPIHSTLRRLASTVIYLEDSRSLRGNPRIPQLDFQEGRWIKKLGKKVVVYELAAEAATSSLAAQKLSIRENEIAEKIGAKDQRYTLIFGPEGESPTPSGGVKRVVRMAALSGIFRYHEGVVERLRRRKPSGAVSRPSRKRKIPPNAEVERR